MIYQTQQKRYRVQMPKVRSGCGLAVEIRVLWRNRTDELVTPTVERKELTDRGIVTCL